MTNKVLRTTILLPLALLSTNVVAEEQILSRSFESDKVYLDTITLRIGSTNAMVDTENVNGGVIGISEPDDSGINVNLTAVFSNGYAPRFKPYLELGRVTFDDRDYNIAGGGVRYDFLRQSERLGFYLKGGAGFIFSNWTQSPFSQPSAGLAGDDSFMLSVQGGADYYFADHWAVDLNLRYDIYDLETRILEASNANASTTWNEKGSLSILVGIVYQFQSGLNQTRSADDDGDGVSNRYDHCSGSLPFVPILDNGCPNSTFNFNMQYEDGVFRLDNFVGKPDFNVVLFMRNHLEFKVKIIGYNENVDDVNNRQEHSPGTAARIKSHLVEMGIDGERIYAYGVDDDHPEFKDTQSHVINRYILVEFFKPAE